MTNMPAEQTKAESSHVDQTKEHAIHMESVQRIAKLPCVESSIQAATNVYEKVKDSHSAINWTLTTAENVGHQAIGTITPLASQVASHLEGPIKKVDSMLCTGLNYAEEKVPCIKKPPGQIVENTKEYLNNTVVPALQTAKVVIQPAVQGAYAVKDFGVQKVEEFLDSTKPKENSKNCEKNEEDEKKSQ